MREKILEQNLANEPAVSVFVYASPKLRLMTTAFLNHLPPHPLRSIPCPKTPKAEGSKHQKVIVRTHMPTSEKPKKSTRIITATPTGRRHASARPYPAHSRMVVFVLALYISVLKRCGQRCRTETREPIVWRTARHDASSHANAEPR